MENDGYSIDSSTNRLLIKKISRVNIADHQFKCTFKRLELSTRNSEVKYIFKEKTVKLVTPPGKPMSKKKKKPAARRVLCVSASTRSI